VTRETDFLKLLFATKARDGRVDILLVRKNKEMVVPVEPALLREHYMTVRHDPLERLGLVVDDRYDDRVMVWKVIPRSPAFYAGIRQGDVITRWGDQRIMERKAFTELVPSIQPGMVALEVNRGSRVRPLRLQVPRELRVGTSDDRFPVSTEPPNRP
jgi:S1-C subfamily serine protease